MFLRECNRSAIKALVASGDVDLAVMGQPAEDAVSNTKRFAPHPSVIIAPPGRRLSGQGIVSPETIAGE